MAITIQDQPSTTYIRPAFAPIEYLISSTNTAQTGFKIVCKIYLNPAAANTLISTQSISVRPSSTQAILSIQDIVKSFVSSNYTLLDGDTVDVTTTALSYFRVVFQEYYNGALQGSTYTSSTIPAYNSSPTYLQFASNKFQDYQIATSALEKNLLSGFSNHIPVINAFSANDKWLKVKTDQKIQLQWLQRNASGNFQVWLRTLNSSFTALTTSVLDLTTTSQNYFALDVGRQELPDHTWSVTPNFTGAKYYAIGIYDESTLELASNAYLYEIDECDTDYTNYELHWLNRWGGFDSFVFDGKSKQDVAISKTLAKYSVDRVSGTSLSYTTSAQRTRPFDTSLSEAYSINSRLLSDFEVVGLEDLATSPEVYWNSPSGFVSVNVSAQTYERKKSEDGKVFSLSLNMTIDNSDKRQW